MLQQISYIGSSTLKSFRYINHDSKDLGMNYA